MARTTSAGTKLLIGTTATDPATDTFVEVGEITDIGEFGRVYKENTSDVIGNRRTVRSKGTFDDGTVTLTLNRDLEDAGQDAMAAALNVDADYNIRIELNDKATPAGHGTRFDFKAQVFSFTTKIGGANSFVGATVKLGINTDVTSTPAT